MVITREEFVPTKFPLLAHYSDDGRSPIIGFVIRKDVSENGAGDERISSIEAITLSDCDTDGDIVAVEMPKRWSGVCNKKES